MGVSFQHVQNDNVQGMHGLLCCLEACHVLILRQQRHSWGALSAASRQVCRQVFTCLVCADLRAWQSYPAVRNANAGADPIAGE